MLATTKRSLPLFFLLLLAAVLFLTDPVRYAEAVRGGVSLWALNVLPATFPFLFLTALMTGLPPFAALARKLSPAGKLFGVSGAAEGAALLAAVSGYPVGARMVYDLKTAGRIGKNETFRAACLASTSGPMFLVGTVGGILYASTAAGWILLVSHLGAVWLVCLFLRRGKSGDAEPPAFSPNPTLLYDSLYNAVISILCVGGAIALFACFGQMLADLGAVKPLAALLGGNALYAEGLLRGLLEMTTGCAALAKEFSPLSLATSCALVTFGGVCVLCQQAAFLTRAGVKMGPFLAVKCAQALLAFGICYGLSAAML